MTPKGLNQTNTLTIFKIKRKLLNKKEKEVILDKL